MKNKFLKLSLFIFLILGSALIFSSPNAVSLKKKTTSKVSKKTKFQEGDIIFQTSQSLQSKAIQLATKSKFSHVGIIIKYNGKLVVLEAVQPIKLTPINTWISQGEKSSYSLKRLIKRDSILTKTVLSKMRKKGKSWLGKKYDIAFDWSDKKLYCSELVWKLYEHGCGLKVGKLKKLKDYDLSHPIVKEAIKQRYGNNIPLESKMISPQAIYESDLLMDVK
ncbi:MAG: YiiX family permuted papain-like enzyme [Flavobacteriales bacterium]